MIRTFATLLSMAVLGCGSSVTEDQNGVQDLGADATDAAVEDCEQPRRLDCEDELILDLALHDDKVSTGSVDSDKSGEDWLTVLDATAGGFGNEHNFPWLYVRFEEDGAVRVDVDDETALVNMSWHLAVRRFVIRTNGGSTGPGCVTAVGLPHGDYNALEAVPEDVVFTADDFYTEDCTLLNDESGLEGSPLTAVHDWWVYGDCVKTTRIPFLIQVDGGRVVKLRVESYYETGQQLCNTDSQPGMNGGMHTWRWRFLD